MRASHPRKWEEVLTFTAIILSCILLNIYASSWYAQWDMTQDKRFTITPATSTLLSELEGDVYVEVYLAGELNAEFKQLQQRILETLEAFTTHSNARVHYTFTDPDSHTDPKQRAVFHQQLIEKGLPQTTVFDVTSDGQRIQKAIFPGAIVSYQGRQIPVLLLKGNKAASAAEQMNQSIEGLEYEFAYAVWTLTHQQRKRIAVVQGHDELTPQQMPEMATYLSEQYELSWTKLEDTSLEQFDLLIVAQPKKPFSEQEKLLLDQYVVKGGNAMFLLDKIQMHADSIPKGGTYGFSYDLNIDDLLFRYGVRVNDNLVQDLQSGSIRVVTGNVGDRPSIQALPWPYYMYVNKFGEHSIVRNLDVVYTRFASTVDTVKAEGIKKSPLLFSSKYSRVRPMPGMITLDEIRQVEQKGDFSASYLPLAWLLEGKFRSLFANRMPGKGILEYGHPAKIVVISDADFICNDTGMDGTLRQTSIEYDALRQQSLSNKEFILNAIAYLTDSDGIINARNRTTTLRLLDTFRLRDERGFWQVLNILVPVLLVLSFGVGRFLWRRHLYARKG